MGDKSLGCRYKCYGWDQKRLAAPPESVRAILLSGALALAIILSPANSPHARKTEPTKIRRVAAGRAIRGSRQNKQECKSIISMMEILPDAIPTKALAWTPMTCHSSLRGTCKRFKSIINSEEFGGVRSTEGFVESAIVVYVHSSDRTGQIWALIDGRWRQSPWTTGRDEYYSTIVSRYYGKDSLLFIGNDFSSASSKYRIYDGDRSTLPWHIEERRSPAVCHYGECTVLAGGFSSTFDEFLSSTEVFDPAVGEWAALPSMPHRTSDAVAGVIGQRMYVAGGTNEDDGFSHLRYLQVYDIARESWELGTPMPESLDMLSGAVVNETFHVVGRSRERNIYTCFILGAGGRAWTETAPICEVESFQGMFGKMEIYRAFEHDGQLLVLRCLEYTQLQKLEDDGKWTEVSLGEFPDEIFDATTGINEVCSIVLG